MLRPVNTDHISHKYLRVYAVAVHWHMTFNTEYTLHTLHRHTHITEYTQLIVYYSYFVSPVAIRVQGEREKYFVGAFANVVKVSATV